MMSCFFVPVAPPQAIIIRLLLKVYLVFDFILLKERNHFRTSCVSSSKDQCIIMCFL